MADQVKLQDPMANLDPFANAYGSKEKAAAQAKLAENQRLRDQYNQQRYAAGEGSAEWNRISGIMHQNDLADIGYRQTTNGIDPVTGQPIAPEFTSLIDPATGQIKSQYQLSQYDPSQFQGYNQFKSEALVAPGQQSAWAQIQMQKQQAEQANAADAAAKQGMDSNAQAQGALQMRGGMGSGAQSSLARDMQRQMLSQRQGISNQGALARLNIGAQDETQRQANLGKLVGYEKDIASAQKNIQGQNLQATMQELEKRRMFESDKYAKNMQAWAGEKEAQATGSGGGGGK